MDFKYFKKYLFKLFVMEMIVFVLAALLWFFRRPQGTPFYLCLFIIGVIFIGLGTLFYFSAKNAVTDDYLRRARGTSMTHDESGRRAWNDMAVSFFQASLFLWSGLIAAGLSLAYDYFQHA